jgi:hypothetical protein
MNAIKMKHEKNKNTSFDRKKIAEEILVNRINFILESNFGKDSINNTNLRDYLGPRFSSTPEQEQVIFRFNHLKK